MLTIGQLAAHAGVTVRAVRHYHAKGLLPEPERDASGYRRYDAKAVVDLIKIRTLADAGVPLARVKELLRGRRGGVRGGGGRDRRAAARRDPGAAGSTGSGSPGSRRATAWRCRPRPSRTWIELRELGVPERMIEGERDAWILVAAHSPEQMPELMVDKMAPAGRSQDGAAVPADR